MRAKRVSKPTAANVTRAIIIFRNVLLLLGGRPLRDSSSSEIISTIGGDSQKKAGVTDPQGLQFVRPTVALGSQPPGAVEAERLGTEAKKTWGNALIGRSRCADLLFR